ncbi:MULTISPECIES: aminotransferase class IV [unclassified Spirosoma]|uniref:aminotransferase class IV n=1 Tax=unclassified Spirosoma TaxID=2621999 RepID=UPI000960378B|nr:MULTISPECIES: aminotransferase class IV [unclassified Spirosoma]MBN8826231.1 aminotransferase class IV [Spirosoma sp.]OJW76875.1 MAG: aminotransferase IV [Spirosoma sp. 48-14]
MFLVYNSDVLSENDFCLSANDRAFQYGDGLFETIRYENHQIWFWSDHIDRLTAGMAALQFNPPDAQFAETIFQHIQALLIANKLIDQSARIKVQVWRQSGGLYTPAQNSFNLLITTKPGSPFSISEKTTTGIYEDFRVSKSPVSSFKTINSLPYVLAGLYKQQHGFDEVVLLNTHGYLSECLASNLFWLSKETLFTPSLETGCINGILRRQLIRLAAENSLNVQEGTFQPTSLIEAEAVFCTNVMGIQWLQQVNGISITRAPSVDAFALLSLLFAQLHS